MIPSPIMVRLSLRIARSTSPSLPTKIPTPLVTVLTPPTHDAANGINDVVLPLTLPDVRVCCVDDDGAVNDDAARAAVMPPTPTVGYAVRPTAASPSPWNLLSIRCMTRVRALSARVGLEGKQRFGFVVRKKNQK